MIEVKGLTKYYGRTRAVHNIAFTVEKGEVLGFLGPNGAGKTTTMRMLTCYLPPTSGTAAVFGHDILEESMKVRRRIGYLPEKNPLYQDMSVESYLVYVARLKGVDGRSIPPAVERSVTRCGLSEVIKRTIGNLSKGFQQRVGIAQAIINDPELLILDEPTIGLDPRQIIDIRSLIKELGEERTVILSSHILPEVNQVCDRVIIVNRGELVAVDTPDNLRERLRRSSMTRIRLRPGCDAAAAIRMLMEIEGVLMAREEEPAGSEPSILVESAPEADVREKALETLVSSGVPVRELYNEEMSLEDIFMRLVTEEGS